MHDDTADEAEQRSEIHFLAALVDELMRTLGSANILSRTQLNEIEKAVADRLGATPRPW